MKPVRVIIPFVLGCAAISPTASSQTALVPGADTTDSGVYEQIQGVEGMEEIEEVRAEDGSAPPRHPGRSALPQWEFAARTTWSGRLQKAAGYRDGTYLGNPLKIRHRVVVRKPGSLTAGIVTEKDPGERDPFDFVSVSLSTGDMMLPLMLTLGNFSVVSGQGLIFGPVRRFGKGTSAAAVRLSRRRVIAPSFSADETRSLRGVAAGVFLGPAEVFLLFSRRPLSTTGGDGGKAYSRDETGYHRTEKELAGRGNVAELLRGAVVRYASPGLLEFGLNYCETEYSAPLRLSETGQRTGSLERRCSIDLTLHRGPLAAFLEWEWWSGFPSVVAGLYVSPQPGLVLVLLHRGYSPLVSMFHGSGFADGSVAGNEEGVYAGLEWRIRPELTASCYLDLNRSLLPGREDLFPERRRDLLLHVRWGRGRSFTISAQYRMKQGETKIPTDGEPGSISPSGMASRVHRGRIETGLGWGAASGCRVRFDFVRRETESAEPVQTGSALSVSMRNRPAGPLTLEIGLVFFDTDTYDSGIYRLERDLPGTMAGATLWGKGARWYLLCAYSPLDSLRVNVKYSLHRRYDRKKIGSGPDELPSNVEERAGIQFDVTL